MANVVVVGSQWGDEGKGKIVDWLSVRADVVARFKAVTMPVIRWSLMARCINCHCCLRALFATANYRLSAMVWWLTHGRCSVKSTLYARKAWPLRRII